MIIWGGYIDGEKMTDSGASYIPSTDYWQPITSSIESRIGHTAIWTGNEMIIWAGIGRDNYLNTGGRYIPHTDEWLPTSQQQAPSPRFGHTAVWTGSQMIVWGGYEANGELADNGGIYNPAIDIWGNLPIDQKPEGKILNTYE